MSTVNPIATPQVSTAFKGKNKKAFEAFEKIANTIPEETLKQTALNDIRKLVSNEAYASAHKKAGEAALEAFKSYFKPKKLTPEQAALERINGMAYAAAARSPEEVKERVLTETLAGHTDFVSGVNEYLSKAAAKNGYKK